MATPQRQKRMIKVSNMRQSGKTLREIGLIFGISPTQVTKDLKDYHKYPDCPNNGFCFLSFRARNWLSRILKTKQPTKEMVVAIIDNELNDLKNNKFKNVGAVTHKEICIWAGINTAEQYYEKTIERYKCFLEKHGYTVKKII